jgi:phage terminase large subunit
MSGRTLQIETAPVLEPLLVPSRYKAAYGGRGSGKSHFFAELMIEDSICNPGLRGICIREVQKDLRQSAKKLIEDKLLAFNLGVADGFEVLKSEIRTPGDGVITFQGMQDHTAESVKSLEGFDRAWVEEAQSLSNRSLQLLIPTIRKKGSEIWFSWNPTRKHDQVDKMFRGEERPTGAVVVETNWKTNPWFQDSTMPQDRLDCLRLYPDQYEHIWEGDYAGVLSGAYYAKSLSEARRSGRIGRVPKDPLMQIRAFWDIGGTGNKADACAIWIAQFIGREIRVLNYYEAVGQELSVHVNWLRNNGYESALCVLPHDGGNHEKIIRITYEGAVQAAGFKTQIIPNQGAGAALKRIEAARRLFPSIWFNQETTQPGLDALGWYHEKRDELRNVGLGPLHDQSSNGADAFGMMCIAYEAPQTAQRRARSDHSFMGV